MSKSRKHVSRRVKGVILGRDSAGLPVDIHIDSGPQQISQRHTLTNRRYENLYCSVSLPEREALDENRASQSHPRQIFNEESNSWDPMQVGPEADAESLSWVDENVQDDSHESILIDLATVYPQREDGRTRRDRLIRFHTAWESVYPDMVQAYLEWHCQGTPTTPADITFHSPIKIYDLFDTSTKSFPAAPTRSLTATLVRHGYIGNAPHHPSVAFSIKVLELFRVLNTRAPGLSLLKYLQGLCELYKTVYPPSLRNQMSCAYDAYLRLLQDITRSLNQELGRDESSWGLRNACPACTYILKDEPPLKYSILIAMDGNNSLKRVPRSTYERDDGGKIISSRCMEQEDPRAHASSLYVPASTVNTFKDEVKRHRPAQNVSVKATQEEGDPVDGMDEPTPCTERWTNLADEESKKMWGIFHETGIFTTVCRHGIVLLFCDMIRSGELAKYPLALIDKLISNLGPNLMIGYDIGCGFSVTANRSPIVGPKIRENGIRFCVGSFHGHAHNRLCQIDWHPLYVEGCGLEDFETCERIFSQSNSLASSTRHASTFHRQQAIVNYFSRWNKEKYADLSTFILNNYKQALQLLRDLPKQLQAACASLELPSTDIFRMWLQEEKEYLKSLKKHPSTSNLYIDYVKTLMKLQEAEKKHQLASQKWLSTPSGVIYTAESLCASRSRTLDTVLVLQKAVADLETKLEIVIPWTPESPEWKGTEELIFHEEYCEALDRLEGLVVSRLFELTKMNQSGIGVKLRAHISKALKTRSVTIRNAVKTYNIAAGKLQPPRPALDVKTVLAYVFVAQFDLLRDSRHDIQYQVWTRAAEREVSTIYWKIERAHEEILRLNVEARRLLTYLGDEENILESLHSRLETTNPFLAHQVANELRYLRNINQNHFHRLQILFSQEGYSGWRTPSMHRSHNDERLELGGNVYSNEEYNYISESDDEERGGELDATIQCIGSFE